jgi:SAM-dependent methyltransferase
MADVDMGKFWDERARENAAFFIDNKLVYNDPDLETFWGGGARDLDDLLNAVGVRVAPDDVVVDIGCGMGRLTRVLAERAAHVYGLDVSAEMLSRAKDHNTELKNVTWLHGDGTTVTGVDEERATACVSQVVFQHIPDPQITLGYIRDRGVCVWAHWGGAPHGANSIPRGAARQ